MTHRDAVSSISRDRWTPNGTNGLVSLANIKGKRRDRAQRLNFNILIFKRDLNNILIILIEYSACESCLDPDSNTEEHRKMGDKLKI